MSRGGDRIKVSGNQIRTSEILKRVSSKYFYRALKDLKIKPVSFGVYDIADFNKILKKVELYKYNNELRKEHIGKNGVKGGSVSCP